MSLRILLIGSGGREHALAWKLAQSPLVAQIYVVPGNGGTAALQKTENVLSVNASRFDQLVQFAVDRKVNFLVPGPEAPLVDGITDYFVAHGPPNIGIFGPSQAAARMEGSKAFSKDFMKRHNIPTAAYETFTDIMQAKAWVKAHQTSKLVIKADGLAAGKGVIIPQNSDEAVAALDQIMTVREFGAAGDTVVIEEFLEGEELSILTFSDNYTTRSLPAAQDHKRALDGDQGLNTGGMGCYAPTPIATPSIMARIQTEIIQPTIDGMRNEGIPFLGCLFTGLMITKDGPKVLEYNVRFGDPECQTLFPLMENDLADLMLQCTTRTLSRVQLRLKEAFSTTVVIAAGGYPGPYTKGTPVQMSATSESTFVFHAGTNLDDASNLITAGGRVIACTAIGSSISDAVERAYTGVGTINFENMHYRRDIAHRALEQKREMNLMQQQNANPSIPTPLTYATSGVSIDAGNELVQRIKPALKRTARPGSAPFTGGFGGTLSLPEAGFPVDSPTLVMGIDGIGTKLMIATMIGNLSTIGIDLVAMNVNDLIVQGAEPLAFLDYYACSKLDVDAAEQFVRGVAEGCVQSQAALVGGETAEMPGIYQGKGDFDAAGCAIGALKKGQVVLPATAEMKKGDVLLGLASSGVHSNGFSLVRKIVERTGLSYSDAAPWEAESRKRSVGEALLEPTKIYVSSLMKVFREADTQKKLLIKGLSHITGGGLTENIPRMLPKALAAEIDLSSWEVPPVLQWLKKQGSLEDLEFARSFNTGVGMVAVVSTEDVETVTNLLQGENETVTRIGRLIDRTGEGVVLQNLHAWKS